MSLQTFLHVLGRRRVTFNAALMRRVIVIFQYISLRDLPQLKSELSFRANGDVLHQQM